MPRSARRLRPSAHRKSARHGRKAQAARRKAIIGHDTLGSIRIVFSASGVATARADYEPFGEAVTIAGMPTGPLPAQQFTGQERDGLESQDYFGVRYYRPRHGRFSQVDPVYAGLFDPQQWNRYAYARNNPLSFVDPDGLVTCKIIRVNGEDRYFCSTVVEGLFQTTNGGGGGGSDRWTRVPPEERRGPRPPGPNQLNWSPRPGAWSIGQCLEHLHHANTVYLPPIGAALEGRAPSPVVEILVPVFGRWFIRHFIAPNPGGATAKAPATIRPAQHVDVTTLDAFLASNRRAVELVHMAGRYDVNRIRFTNPFIPLLRFTVGTGLEIVAKHQARHLLQAEAVRADARFPAAATP